MSDNFKIIVPATLEKAKDGEWKISGLASTEEVDQQGEILIQKGIDASPIDQKRGYLNFEHKQDPENLVGVLDGYTKDAAGFHVKGRLFKNHAKAKAIYEIMSSLGEDDKSRIGMSVEGSVLERDAKNPKIIKKCKIKNVALTFSPVNDKTFASLAKSLNCEAVNQIESYNLQVPEEILQKDLSVGSEYASSTPGELKDGAALSQEDMKAKKKTCKCEGLCKCSKSMKKMTSSIYKSNMVEIMDKLNVLYPEIPKQTLWELFKNRLNTRFLDSKGK